MNADHLNKSYREFLEGIHKFFDEKLSSNLFEPIKVFIAQLIHI